MQRQLLSYKRIQDQKRHFVNVGGIPDSKNEMKEGDIGFGFL